MYQWWLWWLCWWMKITINHNDHLGCHNVHVSVFTSLFRMLDAENFLIAGFSNIWTLPSHLVSVSHKMVNQWISILWHLNIEPHAYVCYSLSLKLVYLYWMNGIKVVCLYSLDGFNWLFIFMKAVGSLVFFTYFFLCVCRWQVVTNMTINIYRYSFSFKISVCVCIPFYYIFMIL